MNHANHKHIIIAALLLATLIVIGSAASEHEWTSITKEEHSSHSNYLNPDTTQVNITLEEAKDILTSTDSDIDSDSVDGELINESEFGIIWQLTSKTIYNESIVASIDPYDGTLLCTVTTKGDRVDSKYLDPNTTEVTVSLEEAKNILLAENPDLEVDSINGQLLNDDDFGIIWQLTSKTSNDRTVLAGIDADDGNLVFIYDGSKETFSDGEVSEEEALEIAEEYMETKLTDEQLNKIKFEFINYRENAYDLPGFYHIKYIRIINGVPLISDGATISVNSETGEVSSYREHWETLNENNYTVDNESILTEEEAAEYLKEFIEEQAYEGKVSNSIEVIESKVIWKYTETDEIRLAWWMKFTDPNLGLGESLPGLVIIDANTGEVLIADFTIG
ncbi:MAG: hypothetical protein PWQ51_2447 [Methanolobus sp.]|jgi:hypothetical protein|uniref:YcdB/YcdC domain-containing protein n=1 Tax=Methanolobus sp. TaxID=1874737 RepID=UPI0024AABF89|nr:YcdB/YcdC domain-containing protein [Methanolobus sp.]MDI3485258.1 hypothetical protein [Methanolobus sp.]MDK2832307.1 hypothetical protein [Methanolobus sp.]MDK2940282.1 hypothetical protein [Methanolobus sp.]